MSAVTNNIWILFYAFHGDKVLHPVCPDIRITLYNKLFVIKGVVLKHTGIQIEKLVHLVQSDRKESSVSTAIGDGLDVLNSIPE
jgi:hypothetical protein